MTLTLVGEGGTGEGGKTPGSLFDDPEVVIEVQKFVDEQAPRVFAVMQETLEPLADLQLVAWGITTKDGVEVSSVHGGMHMSLQSVESTLFFFRVGGQATPRIFWVGGGRGE
ncbi:hypothetical protein AB0I60_32110 [Actinosynnema sp. NPDC050436]|uniref:hypothetical protein n=1 Tax=Actinosynnema sp. NPDC050436 TaxID=3155659 RepID=UPI0033DA01E5